MLSRLQFWLHSSLHPLSPLSPPSLHPPSTLPPLPQAGEVSKALELCFQHHNFDALHQIAEDLGEETSPEMADQVAEYFQQVI